MVSGVAWSAANEAVAEASLVRPGKRHRGAGRVRQPRAPSPTKRTTAMPRGEPEAASPAAEDRDGARRALLVERYVQVLEQRPGDQYALDRLVELHRHDQGNLVSLLRRYEEEVQRNPQAYAARVVLAELYRRGGRLDEARDLLTRAASLRPREAAPQLALAQLARERGDLEALGDALRQALELSEGSDRQSVLRQLRDRALEQDREEEARQYQRQLLTASGNSLYVRLELGQALARLSRHQAAVAELQQVLRQVRGDPRAQLPVLRELAQSQLALGDEEAGLRTLREALTRTRADSGERAELLELVVDVYRRRDALPELAQLLESQGSIDFEKAELLGRLWDELAAPERAQRWYRAALRLQPRHVDSRVRLVRLLIRQGQLEEAIREYEQLTRLAPGEPRFVTELAEMYLRAGRREQALALLARAGRTHSGDVGLHTALLNLYAQWGEEQLALEEARALARMDPRNDRHLVELGERYFQAGDRDRALATWQRLPATMPERWQGLASLGDVYADHDMSSEARQLYEEALRLRPDEIGLVRRLANLMERTRQSNEPIRLWERVVPLAAGQDANAQREARTRVINIWSQQRRLPNQLPNLRRRFARAFPGRRGWTVPGGGPGAAQPLGRSGHRAAPCPRAPPW